MYRPVKFVHKKFLKIFFYQKIYESAARMRQGLSVDTKIDRYLHLVNVRSLVLFLILYKNASHGFSLQSSHFFELGVDTFIYH